MEIPRRGDETFKNMVAEIRWADDATADYHSIVEYLLKYWDIEIASRFIDIVNHKVKQLSLHPEIGIRSTREKNVRSILITRHSRLYYRIVENQIIELD